MFEMDSGARQGSAEPPRRQERQGPWLAMSRSFWRRGGLSSSVPPRLRGRSGFTLVELLVTVAVIAVVAGIVAAAVVHARTIAAGNEAEWTLDQLAMALKAMKDYYAYDDLLGKDRDGNPVPEVIMIGRELDPFNKAYGWNGADDPPEWVDGWRPHLNIRTAPANPARKICKRFFEAKRRRIANFRLVDPWGTPYVYDIVTRSRDIDDDGKAEVIDAERLSSNGPDGVFGTDDDFVREPDRRVRPE